jgi:hypothetical protein
LHCGGFLVIFSIVEPLPKIEVTISNPKPMNEINIEMSSRICTEIVSHFANQHEESTRSILDHVEWTAAIVARLTKKQIASFRTRATKLSTSRAWN